MKKILLVRTDRLGEFILTAPAMRAVHQAYPASRITLCVRPELGEIAREMQGIDELLLFDETKLASLGTKIEFLFGLVQRHFDMIVIFNPSKFFNIVSFLSGIKTRVGYDQKWGFLLTRKIKNLKYQALKNEVEYNLDLLAAIGIEAKDRSLFFPASTRDFGAGYTVMHPGTSNPAKRWKASSFARLADMIKNELGLTVFLIGGGEEHRIIDTVKAHMETQAKDYCGTLGLKDLGALLKGARFLVSNDSGPVHVAAAVGCRCVVMYNKDIPGTHPVRWGPWGEGHRTIYKKLDDITVEEVFQLCREIASSS